MFARSFKAGLAVLVAGVVVGDRALLVRGQEIAPPVAAAPAGAEAPAAQQGVEVMTRGPIHEAFASLTVEAAPTKPVPKAPPKLIDEEPPADKPEGDMIWIGGYWAWDDDRSDYLWVSGTWRATPPGKQWVAGYWREDDSKWQWVPGFWSTAPTKENEAHQVTYLPQPPAQPTVAPPGEAPTPDSFYVPGHFVWKMDHYAWQSGYWARMEPGYVWVAGHYRWTPSGYIYIAGYWDYAVSRRGVLYAPVVIDPRVTVVYTPAYAVPGTVVVDALWVRPSHCHYYFGDYYGVEYRDRGFESCVVYSRGHYDSIIVYERYEHRRDPEWINIQINVYNDRYEHRDARPPRTLVEQTTIINKTTIINNTTIVNKNVVMVAPAKKVIEAGGLKTVTVDHEARVQMKQQAVAVREASVERVKTEVAVPGGAPKQPRVAALSVAKQQPVIANAAQAPVAGAKMPTTAGTGAAAAPVAGAKMPAAGATASTTLPASTTAIHPAAATTTTTGPAVTHPTTATSTVTTSTPPVTPATTAAAHPGTVQGPAQPNGSTTLTKPATSPPSPFGQNTARPGTPPGTPGMAPPGTPPGARPTQPPAKQGDPAHKPPPKDKDDKKDKDKDKNQ